MKQLSRDLAIVGGVSAFGAPGAFVLYTPTAEYFTAVVVAGVLTGPIVALAYARAVGEARGRPWLMLSTVGVLLGTLWGGAVGIVGAFAEPRYAWWSIVLAALSAAAQVGLFGPSLIRRAAEGRRTWPVLIGAAAVAPLLGNLAYFGVGLAARWSAFWM